VQLGRFDIGTCLYNKIPSPGVRVGMIDAQLNWVGMRLDDKTTITDFGDWIQVLCPKGVFWVQTSRWVAIE